MDNYGLKLTGLGLFVHKFSSRNPSQLSLNFSRDQLSVRGEGG